MPRTIAFLRAINVGGRVVTMDRLRTLFGELGLARVETFIASGNVIFETPAGEAEAELVGRIEQHLEASLGYAVTTFLRDTREVAAVAACRPFDAAELASALALDVGFLTAPLDPAGSARLQEFAGETDAFASVGREVYWLRRRKQSESTFSNAVFERALRVRATFRTIKTVERLTAKYPPA